jgi:DNA repair exonuclease SbcCD nuclease subunit
MQSQFDELRDILELSREHEVDFLVHGGDFFDNRKPSHQLVVHLLDWFKLLDKPVYTVIGNHDLLGYNLDSVKNSGLGVLLESGAVDKIDGHMQWDESKIVIKSIHSTLDFQTQYLFDDQYKDYFKIAVSHNYVIPSETMPFGFIHPRDIATNANLVLCGHYHMPFDYCVHDRTDDNTRWINPGAISRWSTADRNKMPQVLLLEVKNGNYTLTHIPLKSAKPGFEIFDLELLNASKEREQDIAAFAKSLESVSFQAVDIESMIKKLGAEQAIEKPILDIVLNKITEAKDILK